MVTVLVIKEGQRIAEVDFGGELSALQGNGSTKIYRPGEKKTVNVRGVPLPDSLLTHIESGVCRGNGVDEFDGFRWRLHGPAI